MIVKAQIAWDPSSSRGTLLVSRTGTSLEGWEPTFSASSLEELLHGARLVLEREQDHPAAGIAEQFLELRDRVDKLAAWAAARSDSASLAQHVGIIEQRVLRIGERLTALEGKP